MNKIKLIVLVIIFAITSCKKEEASQNNFTVNVGMELGNEIYFKLNIRQILDDTTSANADVTRDTIIYFKQTAIKDTSINGIPVRAVESVNKGGNFREIIYYNINDSGIYEIANRSKGYLLNFKHLSFNAIKNNYPNKSNNDFELNILRIPRLTFPKPLKQGVRWAEYESNTFKPYQVISTGTAKTEAGLYNCVIVKHHIEEGSFIDPVEHSETTYISNLGTVKGETYLKLEYHIDINEKIGYLYYYFTLETTKKSF